MEMTKGLLAILLTAILTQNFVLSQFLGICPFLGVSKKLNTAVGMSAAVIFVMALSTAVTYPINGLLVKCDLEYLQTIVFILVIAALVQFVEIVLKKYMPALYSALGIYLPLITPTARCSASSCSTSTRATALRSRCSTRSAQVSASCWRWSCLQACGNAWNPATFRSLCRGCPSRWSRLRSSRCPSSASRASSRRSSVEGVR